MLSLHLVSLPWADPRVPSIQTGTLAVFLKPRTRNVRVFQYPAHAFIPYSLKNDFSYADLGTWSRCRESAYFILYYRKHLEKRMRHDAKALWQKLVRNLDHAPSWRDLIRLEAATIRFIRNFMLPRMKQQRRNIVGFTLNYYQVYASLFVARSLIDLSGARAPLFLIGGSSASYPSVADVFQRENIPGFGVLGEGETKLLEIMRRLDDSADWTDPDLAKKITGEIAGVYSFNGREIDLHQRDPRHFKSALESPDDLPLPDYEPYYEMLRATAMPRRPASREVFLPVEGNRGCFAKCDFCGISSTWEGFRRARPDSVIGKVLTLRERHPSGRVTFMDDVCDTWAEKYADALNRAGITIPSFMELRAHHPQHFWTKLALSGLSQVQVGIESLSDALLRRMRKGTTAAQNLLVQKWLKELKVKSSSNLLLYHPLATPEDVAVTRLVLRQIPHFGTFDLSAYKISHASPQYFSYSPADRAALQPDSWDEKCPPNLRPYLVTNFGYLIPEKDRNKKMERSWRDFTKWYHAFSARHAETVLECWKISPEKTLIVDSRGGACREFHVTGLANAVFQSCHRGASAGKIAADTGLSEMVVAPILEKLACDRILIESGGHFIALPLRDRDTLLRELHLETSFSVPESTSPENPFVAIATEPLTV